MANATNAVVEARRSEPSNDADMSNEPQRLHRIIEEQQQQISNLTEYIASLHTTAAPHSQTPATNAAEANVSTACLESECAAIAQSVPALMRGLTTKQDVLEVARLCRTIVGTDTTGWQELHKHFFQLIVRTRERMPPEVLAREHSLPANWHHEPWYLAYVQYTGVDSLQTSGTFHTLRKLLPYIRHDLGFKNLCLLPHYESPMADGGYDVSSYTVRESLGGQEAFEEFMRAADAHGMRIATDGVYNHTSTEHAWFQQAIAGNEHFQNYYVQRNGREKIAEWQCDGDVICQYRDGDGTLTERTLVFPGVDRTHGLWVEINGQTVQFYRTFYPFQVDLNLRNASVLTELLEILSEEIASGVLAKRLDALPHWIKRPGSVSDGLEEVHAISALLKSFVKHLHKRVVMMPEVVREIAQAVRYAGCDGVVNGEETTREGDMLFAFEMQAALRECVCLQNVAPFWRCVFMSDELPERAQWLNVFDHHDEIYMGFFPREVRRYLGEYIKTHNGVIFKNGRSGSGRLADCCNAHVQRMCTAVLLQYLAPGTAMVYHGQEVGRGNDWTHARSQTVRQKRVFQSVGVYADESACFDGRELHRGRIEKREFKRAVAEQYPVVELVRRLNELSSSEWWPGQLTPVDCGDVGVLCGCKHAADVHGWHVLCVANVTPLPKVVRLACREAARALGVAECAGVRFCDLLARREVFLTPVCDDGSSIGIDLPPFGRLIVSKEEVEEEEEG